MHHLLELQYLHFSKSPWLSFESLIVFTPLSWEELFPEPLYSLQGKFLILKPQINLGRHFSQVGVITHKHSRTGTVTA